ncbi:MAG: putative manganese transporter [Bacilli bacterium]
MMEAVIEAVVDTLKIFPFLYVTYLLMEFIEHKLNKKFIKKISNTKKYGPLVGGLLGIIPQCGFSVSSSSLFASRIITMGTIIAIFLSTSDETIPILLSNNVDIKVIGLLIILKVIIAIIFGYIIDLLFRPKEEKISFNCEEEHCHCNENIFLASLKHSINIIVFILIFNVIFNSVMSIMDLNNINFVISNSLLSKFLICLVSLIPNCVSSVFIAELFVNNTITFGTLLTGSLISSGLGLIVLFKQNKNIKENIYILISLFIIAMLCGGIFDLFNLNIIS